MAENTYRDSTERKANKGVFRMVEGLLKLDTFFDKGLPVRYLPYLLYVAAIGIFYIGNSHYAHRSR